MDNSLIILDETGSTNSEMTLRLDTLPHGAALMARRQTAGRGQRGNSWESEPGANVTMSILLRDLQDVAPQRQFVISEAVALAVADTVARYLPADMIDRVAVKWPNDIYVDDKKIAGILIECGICAGAITHAIVGIGLNVNQLTFVSDAPNPIALRNLIPGHPLLDTDEIAATLRDLIIRSLTPGFDPGEIHSRYLGRLWRRSGIHSWRRRSDGVTFKATIAGVSPDGFLSLRQETEAYALPSFAFKEVEAIL